MIIIATVLSVGSAAFAHKMGDSFWCLGFTSSHQECFYEDSQTCEIALKRVLSFTREHPSKNLAREKDGAKMELICIQNPSRQDEVKRDDPSLRRTPKKWNPDQPW